MCLTYSLRPVYTCHFLCNFCRTFQCIFCRARARDKNCKCKLGAISVRFVAAISQRFRTCSKLDVTWRRFGGNCSKYRTGIAAKSLLVYTCDKSCIGERDKNCIKNRMRKRAFISFAFSDLFIIHLTFLRIFLIHYCVLLLFRFCWTTSGTIRGTQRENFSKILEISFSAS